MSSKQNISQVELSYEASYEASQMFCFKIQCLQKKTFHKCCMKLHTKCLNRLGLKSCILFPTAYRRTLLDGLLLQTMIHTKECYV